VGYCLQRLDRSRVLMEECAIHLNRADDQRRLSRKLVAATDTPIKQTRE
jgi:hypothetical protein